MSFISNSSFPSIRCFLLLIAVCAMACFAQPCRASLVHHYPFVGDASDVAGAANGTLLNGAAVSGGVLLLDGVDDYVQFGEKIVPQSGSYSVAMFVRQPAPQPNHTEFISQGFSGGPGFYIGTNPSGGLRASDSWLSTGVPFPSDDQFHHVALTVDAANAISVLYLNGTPAATLNGAISTTSGGSSTRFGRQFEPYGEFFGGAIYDVTIYDQALTSGEVANLAAPEPAGIALCIFGAVLCNVRVRRNPSGGV
jgi:hypothetical protein